MLVVPLSFSCELLPLMCTPRPGCSWPLGVPLPFLVFFLVDRQKPLRPPLPPLHRCHDGHPRLCYSQPHRVRTVHSPAPCVLDHRGAAAASAAAAATASVGPKTDQKALDSQRALLKQTSLSHSPCPRAHFGKKERERGGGRAADETDQPIPCPLSCCHAVGVLPTKRLPVLLTR
jgi:hypothetical protein